MKQLIYLSHVKIILSLCLIFSYISPIVAQNDTRKLSVELSNDSILIGNNFSLKYTLENIDSEIELPTFQDLEILSGPNITSSFHSINGVGSSSKSYTYILKPTKEGEIIIEPAYVTGEEPLETDYVKIEVYPNPEGIQQDNSFKNSDTEFFFSFPGEDFWGRQQIPQEKNPTKKKRKRKLKKI
jgi:hypothetical protein